MSTLSSDTPKHLDPSELGTKEYWDAIYTLELTNNSTDPDDVGTIWFSDSSAEEKMLEYLSTLPLSSTRQPLSSLANDQNPAIRILDLGTGNGHLLFSLRDEGWQAELVGVDYSAGSVALARQIAAAYRDEDGEEYTARGSDGVPPLTFEEYDIIHGVPGGWLQDGFDVVLDKGTFDAISLSSETHPETGARVFESYASKAAALVKQGGYMLVTSCNWTETELRRWFEVDGVLEFHEAIKFPTYTFGGIKGQSVSSVCFRRC